MGLAGVVTAQIGVEPPQGLLEVHAFLTGGAPADETAIAAMRRHVSAITLRDASAGGGQILAAILVVEPFCHGHSALPGADVVPNFFVVGGAHMSPRLQGFKTEVQEALVAAAITLIETSLGNRYDRAPGGVVLMHHHDDEGASLLQRLSARPIGSVGELIQSLGRSFGLPTIRESQAWLIRSATLVGAAALTLSSDARPMLAMRRRNPATRRLEILSISSELPWAWKLRPLVERLARGEVEQEWQGPPAVVFQQTLRVAEERRG